MVRRRRDRVTSLLRERLDGAGALRQEVDERETARTGNGLADARDLLVDGGFQGRGGSRGAPGHDQVIKLIFEYCHDGRVRSNCRWCDAFRRSAYGVTLSPCAVGCVSERRATSGDRV